MLAPLCLAFQSLWRAERYKFPPLYLIAAQVQLKAAPNCDFRRRACNPLQAARPLGPRLLLLIFAVPFLLSKRV
jgi:hypothetical protein